MKTIPTKYYHNRLSNVGDFVYCLFVFEYLNRKHSLTFDLRIPNNFERRIPGFCDLFRYQPYINSCDYVKNEKNISDFTEFDLSNNAYDTFYAQYFVNYFCETLGVECDYNKDFELHIPNLTNQEDLDFYSNKIIVGDRMSNALDRRRSHHLLRRSCRFEGSDYFYVNETFPFLVNCAIIKASKHPFHSTWTGISIIANMMNKELILYYDDQIEQWPKNTVVKGVHSSTDKVYNYNDMFHRHYLTERQITSYKI